MDENKISLILARKIKMIKGAHEADRFQSALLATVSRLVR